VKKVPNDMVFDHNMNPAYIHTPERVRSWLRYRLEHGYSLRGYQVRIGTTMEFVSLSEYLRKGRD
jgi:hypothetical protein